MLASTGRTLSLLVSTSLKASSNLAPHFASPIATTWDLVKSCQSRQTRSLKHLREPILAASQWRLQTMAQRCMGVTSMIKLISCPWWPVNRLTRSNSTSATRWQTMIGAPASSSRSSSRLTEWSIPNSVSRWLRKKDKNVAATSHNARCTCL